MGEGTGSTSLAIAPACALETARLVLRPAVPELAAAWLAFLVRNDRRFAPTDPPRPADFLSLERVEAMLAQMERGHAQGHQVSYALTLRGDTETIVGTCRFSQIARGPFQSCMLGYALDRAHEGRGLMTEALRTAIDHQFDVHRLHRIQANHLPENTRSAAVLARLGFVREGLAARYLHIGGTWRDHVLNALINPRYVDRWLDAMR